MSDIRRFWHEFWAATFQGFDDLMMREAEMSDEPEFTRGNLLCPICGGKSEELIGVYADEGRGIKLWEGCGACLRSLTMALEKGFFRKISDEL